MSSLTFFQTSEQKKRIPIFRDVLLNNTKRGQPGTHTSLLVKLHLEEPFGDGRAQLILVNATRQAGRQAGSSLAGHTTSCDYDLCAQTVPHDVVREEAATSRLN